LTACLLNLLSRRLKATANENWWSLPIPIAVIANALSAICKKIDNVTIYHLLYPVLGEDSKVKSRNIACAKDRAKTWNDWMLQGIAPPAVACDTHNIDAIVEFGKKNRINGTPTLFAADGTRVPGAIEAAQIESMLNAVKP